MGSVWLLFSAEGKRFLFSGDYVEKSVAYKCDKIRDVSADLAVIDTAYGTNGRRCGENLKSFRQYVSDEYQSHHISFYPVPSHGRGLDVIRILIENGCEVYADEYLIQELRDTEDRKSWLRKGMIRASESDHLHPLMQFPIGYACVLRARQRWQQGSGNYLKVKEYSEKSIVPESAIVVPDTQIAKEWNRDTALHILDADFNLLQSYSRQTNSGYTAQGMGSDEDYVYFPMSGGRDNILEVYSWDGSYVTTIHIDQSIESESMFWVNDTYYVSYNRGSASLSAPLHRIDFHITYGG